MEDKARKLLEEMESQEAYYVEQLAMTRGAIQILNVLLDSQESKDEKHEPISPS